MLGARAPAGAEAVSLVQVDAAVAKPPVAKNKWTSVLLPAARGWEGVSASFSLLSSSSAFLRLQRVAFIWLVSRSPGQSACLIFHEDCLTSPTGGADAAHRLASMAAFLLRQSSAFALLDSAWPGWKTGGCG